MDLPSIAKMHRTLEGPGFEPGSEGRAGFAPLVLHIQPGPARVEVSQTAAVIGRHSDADIRLAYPEISRRHCRVVFAKGQWRLVDLNSLNGVWVNGERMLDVVLYDGDRVRIGSCVLTVERGTAVRMVTPPRKSEQEAEVLQSIADVLPRQAG
jgi:pSer/pThr/pTyr-binding forkhead associated (FHA) protein